MGSYQQLGSLSDAFIENKERQERPWSFKIEKSCVSLKKIRLDHEWILMSELRIQQNQKPWGDHQNEE